MTKLTIVIPAFNEEPTLKTTLTVLIGIMNEMMDQHQIDFNSDILIVDDGSSDATWDVIQSENGLNRGVKGIRFSRNYGHQNALIAGLTSAVETADVIVTIDADLQDNPRSIIEMVAQYHAGNQIVYGVRNNRASDTWFKRTTAGLFYKTLNKIGVKLIPNHADFRLMSKQAVQTFLEYGERNMFIRGLVPLIGYQSTEVYYERTPRLAGESKYPLKKMLAFAWDGITSLSIAPVRLILFLGTFADLLGVGMLVYSLLSKFLGLSVHGWSSLMVSIWILGGLQMISLGIIGEYIGKIMSEVKHRPRYTISAWVK